LEYRRTARRHWMFYAATNAGLVLAIAAFRIDLAWVRATAITVGLILFFGGLLSIIRNWQVGSRVDFETHQLIWWEGYPPSDEHHISLERIRSIRLDDESGQRHLKLLDIDDQPIPFSSRCVPLQKETWARSLIANFPHITLRRNFLVVPEPDPIAARQDSNRPADLQ
jgi:hypothetical protein